MLDTGGVIDDEDAAPYVRPACKEVDGNIFTGRSGVKEERREVERALLADLLDLREDDATGYS